MTNDFTLKFSQNVSGIDANTMSKNFKTLVDRFIVSLIFGFVVPNFAWAGPSTR